MGRDTSDRVVRLTRGKLSFELSLFYFALLYVWRFFTWGFRRTKPIYYHPTALLGVATFIASTIISPWLYLAPLLTLFGWFVGWPESYMRHAHPRWLSFLAGFKYRYRPRRRLGSFNLISDQDPVPTISHVRKTGCITNVRIKMSDGDEIQDWRIRSARLAQTYNALDCKVNPYRRETLVPWKHEMVTKPRWLQLEFLTRDPFSTGIGAEFIDFWRADDTFTPVIAIHRNGQPEHDDLEAHKLAVAMTQWGKSTRIRARIYANRHLIREGLLELWGIDGKGGVEQSLLQHLLARVAYGDTELNPNSYNPAEFDRLLKDAVKVLKRRQRKMRGNTTHHTPTKKEPWLLIIIDELLVLTSKAISPELRTSIAASIMLIQQQGIACGVSLDASTQLAQKERIDFRDGFTEFEVGKVEKGAVDMIFGSGWWERGARCDEIPKDLRGVFYKKTDSTMVPTEIRYPNIPVADLSRRALGFEVEKSVLWSPVPHLKPVRNKPAEEEVVEEVVEEEQELVPAMSAVDHLGGFA